MPMPQLLPYATVTAPIPGLPGTSPFEPVYAPPRGLPTPEQNNPWIGQAYDIAAATINKLRNMGPPSDLPPADPQWQFSGPPVAGPSHGSLNLPGMPGPPLQTGPNYRPPGSFGHGFPPPVFNPLQVTLPANPTGRQQFTPQEEAAMGTDVLNAIRDREHAQADLDAAFTPWNRPPAAAPQPITQNGPTADPRAVNTWTGPGFLGHRPGVGGPPIGTYGRTMPPGMPEGVRGPIAPGALAQMIASARDDLNRPPMPMAPAGADQTTDQARETGRRVRVKLGLDGQGPTPNRFADDPEGLAALRAKYGKVDPSTGLPTNHPASQGYEPHEQIRGEFQLMKSQLGQKAQDRLEANTAAEKAGRVPLKVRRQARTRRAQGLDPAVSMLQDVEAGVEGAQQQLSDMDMIRRFGPLAVEAIKAREEAKSRIQAAQLEADAQQAKIQAEKEKPYPEGMNPGDKVRGATVVGVGTDSKGNPVTVTMPDSVWSQSETLGNAEAFRNDYANAMLQTNEEDQTYDRWGRLADVYRKHGMTTRETLEGFLADLTQSGMSRGEAIEQLSDELAPVFMGGNLTSPQNPDPNAITLREWLLAGTRDKKYHRSGFFDYSKPGTHRDRIRAYLNDVLNKPEVEIKVRRSNGEQERVADRR